MQIVYKNVDELIPYVNNPRINDHAVDAVASSIKNFGFKVPIIIDAKNEIVAGHTRLKAAKKLGMKEVPAIVADDLTDEQVRAFRLADNKASELAEWDYGSLYGELELIQNIDMDSFGFDEILSDVDLDDLFIENPHADSNSTFLLKWHGGNTLTTQNDIEFLNSSLDKYNSEEREISFVEYIISADK